MRVQMVALAATACVALASACGSSTTGAQPCVYASDGVCDEPYDCPLGTDEVDCAATCASDPESAPIACSARGIAAPESPTGDPPGVGSGGIGGPVGAWDGTLQARATTGPSDLIDRFFRVYVPARYDPALPAPVLYVLGGFRVSMYALASYTEIERTADENGFIVVYLEAWWHDFGGAGLGWVWDWMVYTSQWQPPNWTDDPDADFVSRLTAQLGTMYNVDRTRVFASGHSRGAAESIMLAYLLPDVVAGYCAESGFTNTNLFQSYIQGYQGTRKVPGFFFHGTADGDVPYTEATSLRDLLTKIGYVEGTDFVFYGLQGVTHRWQPWMNQLCWDFLYSHPLPKEMLK